MVYGVLRVSRIASSSRCCSSGSRKASSTLPVEVTWAALRPPTRLNTGMARGLSRRST